MSEESNRELTFGEKAVGLSFNPSQNEDVKNIKEAYARVIDISNDAIVAITDPGRERHPEDGEVIRMHKIAITEAQTAQMWAVKAVTWNL